MPSSAEYGKFYDFRRTIAKLLGDREQSRIQHRRSSRYSTDRVELLVLYVGYSKYVGLGNAAGSAIARNLRSTRNNAHGLCARLR